MCVPSLLYRKDSLRARMPSCAHPSATKHTILSSDGQGEQSTFGREEKHPGPDPRNVHEQEQDKGRKAGLAHKGKQQGAI